MSPAMNPERWEQVGELYHAALELEAAERAAFLDQACDGDQELRREVESLLAADRAAGKFIAEPAMKDAARMLAEERHTSLASPMPRDSLTKGSELGQYKIVSLLGRGGMGEVYLAYDFRLERQVALKLLPAHFTSDTARVRRFVQEARAVSALNHPNIITIYDIGQSEKHHYIITEFIEGRTLRQLIAQDKLSLHTALDIARQTASAMAAAHAAGIIHRDIKPENIMVRPDGLVKVLDFGLAKLTEGGRGWQGNSNSTSLSLSVPSPRPSFSTAPGIVMGTVAYMSPEQLRGDDVDARSDLFSFGILCYEMIAGRRPFTGATNSHVIVSILDQEPAPLSHGSREVPATLQTIIGRALAKDREQRYQQAEEMLSDLKSLKLEPEREISVRPAESMPQPMEIQPTSQIHFQPTSVEAAALPEPVTPMMPMAPVVKDTGPLRRQLTLYRRGSVLAISVLAATVVAFFYFKDFNRSPKLTERDTVLLADFENKTGDEVFDGTLKQALAVQLEQTPFLDLFSDDQARETLRYMGRSADVRLTREVAREICQRQGLKAMLTGSIAQLDRRYSIILEAINSQTGEITASVLVEAEGKDQVLRALGRAATQLRERLGESLASIQKFAAPPEQATTSSLEAFRAWSRGVELGRTGKRLEAIPFYKLARELDPNFARADVSLSLAYGTGGQRELAAEHAANAYALRDQVTERERFDIEGTYHTLFTGDMLKAIEMYELLMQTYPRDFGPRVRLATVYRFIGEVEKSLTSAREASELNPRAYLPQVRIGTALMQLNRFDEAQGVIEQVIKQFPDSPARGDLYKIALLKGDSKVMRQQLDWAPGKPEEHRSFHWQAQSALFAGRLRQARDLYTRAAAQAEPRFPERAAAFSAESLLNGAACGLCQPVKNSSAFPRMSARIHSQSDVPVVVSRALALALCGETERAQLLAAEVHKENPHSTLVNLIWLPVLAAAIELQRGHPDLALQALQVTVPYERAALFWPNYLRGQAYLRLNQGKEAAAEFQKILDHRGWDVLSPLYTLAHLELARATAMAGDAARSRKAYQSFLTLWKDADSEALILRAAQREYEKASAR